jgi:hypothetical protein
MRVRYLLVAAACAFCLLTLSRPQAPAEPQVSATKIDFDALHAQAESALEALRQSPRHQPAYDIAAEF